MEEHGTLAVGTAARRLPLLPADAICAGLRRRPTPATATHRRIPTFRAAIRRGEQVQVALIINSTLQPTLGLRWLLCYENDRDICHLLKAAPKHWFAAGERIAVDRCRRASARSDGRWKPAPARVGKSWCRPRKLSWVSHIHPPLGGALRTTSAGKLQGNVVVLSLANLGGGKAIVPRGLRMIVQGGTQQPPRSGQDFCQSRAYCFVNAPLHQSPQGGLHFLSENRVA